MNWTFLTRIILLMKSMSNNLNDLLLYDDVKFEKPSNRVAANVKHWM